MKSAKTPTQMNKLFDHLPGDLSFLSFEQLLEVLQSTSTVTLIMAQTVTSAKLAQYAAEDREYPVDDVINLQALTKRYIQLEETINQIQFIKRQAREAAESKPQQEKDTESKFSIFPDQEHQPAAQEDDPHPGVMC